MYIIKKNLTSFYTSFACVFCMEYIQNAQAKEVMPYVHACGQSFTKKRPKI